MCVCVCLRVSLVPVVRHSCPVLSCLCLVLSPGSTLSAQSVPTMYPGQLALLAPGGLPDSASSTLLQPLKPSPSSNNLCSAYTSEGALSVPSLCAPTPGRHVAVNPSLQQISQASPTTSEILCIQTNTNACRWFVFSPPQKVTTHIFFCLSLSVSLCVMANCYILPVYSSTCLFPSFSPVHFLSLFCHLVFLCCCSLL